jgi:hypothetical protein
MGKITGTCDWRDFSLPFDPTGASGPPTRLEINLILPGHGTVYITPVKLVKYSAGFSLSSESDRSNSGAAGWWPANAAPWVGGIGGPLIGLMGGLLGWLSQKGMARVFVLTAWKCAAAFGLVCLIATIIAVSSGSPGSLRCRFSYLVSSTPSSFRQRGQQPESATTRWKSAGWPPWTLPGAKLSNADQKILALLA